MFFPPLGFPDWCLARNVISTDRQHGTPASASFDNPKMKLTRMWGNTLSTIEDLQSLLTSDQLYKNQVAHAALSEGFEAGHMRQSHYLEPQQLSKTLTTAAEAHFRMELWYALSRHQFQHSKSTASYDSRVRSWKDMIPKVYKDRTDNEDAAWALRVENMNAEESDSSADGASDAGDATSTADGENDVAMDLIDPKYL